MCPNTHTLRVGKQNPWQAGLVARPCNFVYSLVQSCKICTIVACNVGTVQMFASFARSCKIFCLQRWQACKIGTTLQTMARLLRMFCKIEKMVAPCKHCTVKICTTFKDFACQHSVYIPELPAIVATFNNLFKKSYENYSGCEFRFSCVILRCVTPR